MWPFCESLILRHIHLRVLHFLCDSSQTYTLYLFYSTLHTHSREPLQHDIFHAALLRCFQSDYGNIFGKCLSAEDCSPMVQALTTHWPAGHFAGISNLWGLMITSHGRLLLFLVGPSCDDRYRRIYNLWILMIQLIQLAIRREGDRQQSYSSKVVANQLQRCLA